MFHIIEASHGTENFMKDRKTYYKYFMEIANFLGFKINLGKETFLLEKNFLVIVYAEIINYLLGFEFKIC